MPKPRQADPAVRLALAATAISWLFVFMLVALLWRCFK
jgi:hypothetical protein